MTHNGKEYDPIIEGDDITLQNPHQDLVFTNGYKKLREDLEADYRREFRSDFGRTSEEERDALIEESVKESIKDELDSHCQWLMLNCSYEVVTHNLN